MRLSLFIALLTIALRSTAQIAPQDVELLRKYERELAELSYHITNDSTQDLRGDACFAFIPKLVEALKVKGSFNYPFDSVNVSIVQPADNAFRVFTWQLRWGNGLFRQYGAIQMNTPDKLTLFPLFDDSDSLGRAPNQVLGMDTWFGAIYYKVLPFKQKNKTYYVLFGYDQNDLWSSKKLLEVLHFEKNKPVFGAPVFEYKDSTGNTSLANRVVLEFKKDAGVTLNYSEQEKIIMFDHLIAPEDRLSDLHFTFVPDGSYEGFKLKKGKWVHIEKIKTIDIGKDDAPPMPEPKF